MRSDTAQVRVLLESDMLETRSLSMSLLERHIGAHLDIEINLKRAIDLAHMDIMSVYTLSFRKITNLIRNGFARRSCRLDMHNNIELALGRVGTCGLNGLLLDPLAQTMCLLKGKRTGRGNDDINEM